MSARNVARSARNALRRVSLESSLAWFKNVYWHPVVSASATGAALGLLSFVEGVAPASFVTVGIVGSVSTGLNFVVERNQRKSGQLILLAETFLQNADTLTVDRMLGVLIGSGRRPVAPSWLTQPAEGFFDRLEVVCRGGDWELRRRVSEALQALGRVNRKRTGDLAAILRADWDPRWKSDVRRRVIESLYLEFRAEYPLLPHMDPATAKQMLLLQYGDTLLVALAVNECLYSKVGKKMVSDKVREEILVANRRYAENRFDHDDLESFEWALDILQSASGDSAVPVDDLESIILHDMNDSKRIAAARLALSLPGISDDDRIRLGRVISDSSCPKNVRRVAAREVNVRFLVRMHERQPGSVAADEILDSLVRDSDGIIARSAFDVLEYSLNMNDSVMRAACLHLEQAANVDVDLKARATRLIGEWNGTARP